MQYKYGVSQAGNYLHAKEFFRRYEKGGVLSVALNPGNLDSESYRDVNPVIRAVVGRLVLHPTILGAYTMLFAGLSEEVTGENLERSDWSE